MAYQLEIHHIDVGGGDATLILVRNLEIENLPIVHSVVVDLGGVGAGPKKLNSYIDWYTGDTTFKTRLDLFIASHYHDDHIRGVIYNKKIGRARKKTEPFLRFNNLIDIGYDNNSYYPKGRTISDDGRVTNLQKNYRTFRNFQIKNKCNEIILPFLNPARKGTKPTKEIYEYQLKDGDNLTGYSIKFLCGKGVLYNGEDVLQPQINKTKRPIDANDLSIGFMLLGPDAEDRFSYFSAGDLSGDLLTKSYYNLEAPLIKQMSADKMLAKPVTVVKAMHHGSNFNNHDDYGDSKNPVKGFLNALNPQVIIVPCNQAKKVPAPEFLENILLKYLTKNKTSKAYFLNKLVFGKKNKKMFGALSKLNQLGLSPQSSFADKATNITIVDQKQASINSTTSIILVHPRPAKSPLSEAAESQRVQFNNFTAFFSKVILEGQSSDYAVTASASQLSRVIDAYLVTSVREGINKQFNHLSATLKAIKQSDLSSFRQYESYIMEMLPALIDKETLEKYWKKEIVTDIADYFKHKTTALIEDAFFTQDETKNGWIWRKKILEDDDEITLLTLIYRSEYQIPFLRTDLYSEAYRKKTEKRVSENKEALRLAKYLFEHLPAFDYDEQKYDELLQTIKDATPVEKKRTTTLGKRKIDYRELDEDEYDYEEYEPSTNKRRTK